MAYQGITTGTSPNDNTGDSLLAGAVKINSNFEELYTSLGNGSDILFGLGLNNSFSGANLFSSLGGIGNTSNKTILTSYVYTPAIGNYTDIGLTGPNGPDAAPIQVGIGAVFAIDKARIFPASIEFYKTRGNTVYEQSAIQNDDGIGSIYFSGSNGTSSINAGGLYCNVPGYSGPWSETNNGVCFRFRFAGAGTTTQTDRFFIGNEWFLGDNVGPNTIQIPNVPTTVAAASAGWDASNRLIKSSSSIKYKTQVEDVEKSYSDNVFNLRPVWYRSKTDADKSEWSWYGLIAEEVAEIDPRLVHWGYAQDQYEYIEDGPNQYKTVLKSDAKLTPEGVQYDRIGVLLLNVIKEQKEKIESLENRIQELELKL